MRVVAAMAMAALMAMAGCGSDDDEEDTAGGGGSTATSSSSTSSTSAVAVAAPTAGQALCLDPAGDVTTGPGTDLVQVVLDRQASGTLTVVYELAGEAAAGTGTTSWVLAVDQGASPLLSLGVKAVGTGPPTSYIFDFRDGSQTPVAEAGSVKGNQVTAQFPASLDPLLAGDFHWQAVTNNGEADVDRCEGSFPQN